MKIILKLTLCLLLLFSVALSLVSCDKNYTEASLSYSLPKSFEEKNYQGITKAYSDGKAEFVLIVWSRKEISSQWDLPSENFTIDELASVFITLNEYDCEYKTNNKKDMAYLEAYATMYYDSDDQYYFYNVLAVDPENVYIVTMDCPEQYAKDYKSTFKTYAQKIKVK